MFLPVGTGWSTFSTGIMSVGGDILLGIRADGGMYHYRFRRSDGTWPVAGTRIGSRWASFRNVTAKPDACHLT